ncbi:MAG: hypothetical protein GX992_01285 [Clostridium sp.]|nr:hypothetical protein [Clostridium sp.]
MKRINYGLLICLVTGFIGGAIVGCIAASTLISYRIDCYHSEIISLKILIEEGDIKYRKLKESFDNMNKKRFLISDVKVYLLQDGDDGDNFDKMELTKYIKDKYKDLLWKEVRNIDMDLAVKLVDEHVLVIEGRKYKLDVNRVLASDVFQIWINAKQIE